MFCIDQNLQLAELLTPLLGLSSSDNAGRCFDRPVGKIDYYTDRAVSSVTPFLESLLFGRSVRLLSAFIANDDGTRVNLWLPGMAEKVAFRPVRLQTLSRFRKLWSDLPQKRIVGQ